MQTICVYLKNNYCMFYKLPTCPGNKKCRGLLTEQTVAKPTRNIIYPKHPDIDHRMHSGTLTMIENHKLICDMYFRENRSYFYIAANLHVPAHIARNYLDRHVKGKERYD